MAIRWFSCAFILMVFLSLYFSSFVTEPKEYEITRLKCTDGDLEFIGIRRFVFHGLQHVLVVDPSTFDTQILDAKDLECNPVAENDVLFNSRYFHALFRYSNSEEMVSMNEGFKGFDVNCSAGVALTIDMCQGPHPYDKRLFQKIAEFSRLTDKTVHVAIAVTGKRMRARPRELDEIQSILKPLRESHHLEIRWINHSHNHPYRTGIPDHQNFFATKSLPEFETDVLANEKLMIANGLTPSIFFRFPGLVSTRDQLHRLNDLGLIPIGTNAWLALDGEKNKNNVFVNSPLAATLPGAMILIHGNGREPKGVNKMIGLLDHWMQMPTSRPELISIEKALSCESPLETDPHRVDSILKLQSK